MLLGDLILVRIGQTEPLFYIKTKSKLLDFYGGKNEKWRM
jgi:hypothetical protein